MNRAHVPTKRRLPSNRTVSDETQDDIAPTNNSITTTVSNGSKPVPSPKPKPRHHKDFARTINDLHVTATTSDLHTKTTNDLHTTTSDLHAKTTSDLHTTTSDLHTTTNDLHTTTNDLHTKTTNDLHTKAVTIDPLTHTNTTSSTAMVWSTLSPSDNITSTNTITTTTIKTTSGQAKIRTSEVHVKPLTATSELQTTGTTGIVRAYLINTNIDDTSTKTTSVKLQAKPHVKVTNDPHTTSISGVSCHTKTASDLPLMTDSHTKIDTDDNFHTTTTDNLHTTATKHMLDVVSDHVVEETDIGWSPTHRVTTNDEVASKQRKRLKGTSSNDYCTLLSSLCRD